MHARIVAFKWPDLGRDGEKDSTLLTIVAGPSDGAGEETFNLTVCTMTALQRMVDRDGFVIGRHHLVVDGIAPRRVEEFLRARIQTISGATWTEVAGKIGRIGQWEFEDYTP